MSRKHLQLKPHVVSPNIWWYEECDGINIYHRDGTDVRHAVIQWTALRAALKRKDKKCGLPGIYILLDRGEYVEGGRCNRSMRASQ